eukprot:5281086-Pleurochrysis_carterae.AAC.2
MAAKQHTLSVLNDTHIARSTKPHYPAPSENGHTSHINHGYKDIRKIEFRSTRGPVSLQINAILICLRPFILRACNDVSSSSWRSLHGQSSVGFHRCMEDVDLARADWLRHCCEFNRKRVRQACPSRVRATQGPMSPCEHLSVLSHASGDRRQPHSQARHSSSGRICEDGARSCPNRGAHGTCQMPKIDKEKP